MFFLIIKKIGALEGIIVAILNSLINDNNSDLCIFFARIRRNLLKLNIL